MLRNIVSDEAPAPVGPYSQAIKAGPMLFISGQVALGPTGQEALPEGVAAQATKVMDNISAILAEAGAGWGHVCKASIFLTTMADFATVNAIYEQYLALPYPARETVAVVGLPKGAFVEISVTAYMGQV